MLTWGAYHKYEKTFKGASERAQQIKALAAKPDNPSSIPGKHIVEGENLLPQVIL